MQPWMNDKDIQLIENEVLSLNKQHLDILEWGSGGSTKYFSEFMSKHDISYSWVSIEYNKKWFKKISELKIPSAEIFLFDVGNSNLKQRNTNMDRYVEFPSSLEKEFDLILVDGRKRRRCLESAATLVKPSGVVLLHDAQRKYYHCAFKSFKDHSFLSKTLWRGNV